MLATYRTRISESCGARWGLWQDEGDLRIVEDFVGTLATTQ